MNVYVCEPLHPAALELLNRRAVLVLSLIHIFR